MLEQVSVRGFKSIEDLTLDLGLINVFVGANGSGKSNVLEAIGILGAAAAGRVDDESLLRRGVRPGVPQLYKTSFRDQRLKTIDLTARAAGCAYRIELQDPLEGLAAWRFKTEQLTQADAPQRVVWRTSRAAQPAGLDPESGLAALKLIEFSTEAPLQRLMGTLRDFAIYAPNTATLRGLVPDPQARPPLGLHGGRLAEALQELWPEQASPGPLEAQLDELIDLLGWVQSFGTGSPEDIPLSPSIPAQRRVVRFVDRYMPPRRNLLSAYDASEGALYLLFAAVLALHRRAPRCFAIDNVDATLNPRLARGLIQHLCRWTFARPEPRQLLLTCHNPLALDGLPIQDERVRLFAVDRSSRGRTVVQRVVYTDKLRALAEEKGWPLSRLWVLGDLGGVPNL